MQKSRTVLLVDDDPDWLHFLERAVGAEYKTMTASSGSEAMEKIAKNAPDVIITDVMMPGGKNGFTLMADLKAQKKYRNIPIIILTEVNLTTGLEFSSERLQTYLGSGPAAFIEKPITARKLLQQINSVI